MAEIRTFCAVHPAEGLASKLAALPYDVYSRDEAREQVKKAPESFLAIDRPETQFPKDQDMYAPEVYQKAHDMLEEWIKRGSFVQDQQKCYYLYELTMDGRSQTGLVACASIDDYLNGRKRAGPYPTRGYLQCTDRTDLSCLPQRSDDRRGDSKNKTAETDVCVCLGRWHRT